MLPPEAAPPWGAAHGATGSRPSLAAPSPLGGLAAPSLQLRIPGFKVSMCVYIYTYMHTYIHFFVSFI